MMTMSDSFGSFLPTCSEIMEVDRLDELPCLTAKLNYASFANGSFGDHSEDGYGGGLNYTNDDVTQRGPPLLEQLDWTTSSSNDEAGLPSFVDFPDPHTFYTNLLLKEEPWELSIGPIASTTFAEHGVGHHPDGSKFFFTPKGEEYDLLQNSNDISIDEQRRHQAEAARSGKKRVRGGARKAANRGRRWRVSASVNVAKPRGAASNRKGDHEPELHFITRYAGYEIAVENP
jgi:hypothetical protein